MKVSMKALLGAAICLMLAAGQASAQSGPFGFGALNTPELGPPTKMKDGPNFDWGGWMQLGWQEQDDGAFTGNGPLQNQDEHGQIDLNQLYTYVSKTADGINNGIDWGFRVDTMYGVDGNEAQAFGNIDPGHWDFLNGFGGPGDPVSHGAYEFAAPQAYLEVAVGAVSTKIGRFYTPIGNEAVTSPSNFFLSRHLTFYNSIPFTHTGMLSTAKLTDTFSVSSGWTVGMDSGFHRFHNAESGLAGFTWNITDNIDWNCYFTGGNLGWRGNGWISSSWWTLRWTDRMTTVTQLDMLATDLYVNAAGVPYGPGANVPSSFITHGIARDSFGATHYSFYNITDKLAFGTRMEWWKGDGVSYFTQTAGLNWKPHANLIFRPEVRRLDSPADGRDLYNRTVFGADMILTF